MNFVKESRLKTETRISELLKAKAEGEYFVSVECFPPKSDEGVTALFKTLASLVDLQPKPLFVDFTWGAGGSTSDLTVDLCVRTKEELGAVPNMHLTCTNMEREKIDKALQTCRDKGITNVLALRGDPPVGQERWVAADAGFSCALDLVSYIRKTHGEFFCISVAGYPEGHPDKMKIVENPSQLSITELARCRTVQLEGGATQVSVCHDDDYAEEINYLRRKVDAGAECIITQMFFDTEVYGSYVTACRAAGITVPIIPGLMLINSYAGFLRMTGFCKSRVPEAVLERLERIKDSEEEVRSYAVEFGVAMCRRLLELGAPDLHFYTLNAAAITTAIINQLQPVRISM